MRNLLAAVVVLGAISLPKTALAETLVPLLINETAITIIDVDSIRNIGQMKRAWVYVGLPQDRAGTAYTAALFEFDCASERYRTANRKFFDIRGRMTSEERDTTAWSIGLPVSPGTSALRAVCEDNYSRSAALPGYSILQLVEQYRRLAASRG